jgi:hypothetical protein
MSIAEILEQLPSFTSKERQILLQRVLDLEEMPLSSNETALIQERLAGHHDDPASSIPLEAMKIRLRSRGQ